jgi:hypothetical protein
MRICLLDRKTGLYFQSLNSWTADARAAQVFEDSRQAALFAKQLRREDLEVYLDFDNEEYNVSLPVQTRLQYS